MSRVGVGMRNQSDHKKHREVLTCKREGSKCFCYDLCFSFLRHVYYSVYMSTVFCKAELQANIAVQSLVLIVEPLPSALSIMERKDETKSRNVLQRKFNTLVCNLT